MRCHYSKMISHKGIQSGNVSEFLTSLFCNIKATHYKIGISLSTVYILSSMDAKE